MADHSKAKHHHSKAGDAFARGDMKNAAHHMGHALAALRGAAAEAAADDDAGVAFDDPENPGFEPAKPSIRDRLKGFGKKK